MFARLNNHEASVLYCGPSNKSVDVVLGMLTNLTIIKFISLTLLLGRYDHMYIFEWSPLYQCLIRINISKPE